MDAKLAEIVRLLARETRGRGWRVAPQLKQQVAAWVHEQRARGVKLARLAAASGLGAATLVRWAASHQGASKRNLPQRSVPQGTAPQHNVAKRSVPITHGSPTATTSRTPRNDFTPQLPLRRVAVQADHTEPSNAPIPTPRAATAYRVLLVDGLDLAALIALTRRWAGDDRAASPVRDSC